MKVRPVSQELISNMRAFFQPNNSNESYLDEEPLRAELFSSEQMERLGKSLAGKHKLTSKRAKDHLLKRLTDNETILHETRKLLTQSIKRKQQITPAGEWLIDNFYLIEEQIRNARRHFPKDYSEDLPQISNTPSANITRVYDIVLQIISHTDGRIDIESLDGFIKAYQSVTYLQLGELWAIPIILRLALIENLRRVSSLIAIDRVNMNFADYWAKQLIETSEKEPKNLILVIADMARSSPPMASAFVSELTRQLRGKGPELALALNWIEQELSENGLTSTELVNAEIQKQSAHQVSVSNSIGSLRFVGATDWRNFVESHSIVEQTLRKDNNGIYALMDFRTRDSYRHVVEGIAKKSKISEYEVACIAIQLMQENALQNEKDERTSHVGYYLIGPGVLQTEKLAKMHISGFRKIQRAIKRNAFPVYITLIFLIAFLIASCVFFRARSDTKNDWLLLSISFLAFLCASQLAVSLVNFFSALIVKPNLLPRMDFSESIPSEFSTMIVVPMMLTNEKNIEDLVESIEVRFLANRKNNLHYGLLTDFTDAEKEVMPDDNALVNLVKQRIEELNNKYQRKKNDLFYLFHRPRRWNPKENVWMGHERKRGKLSELNLLLRGSSAGNFSVIVGDQTIFPGIKYVITLDSDTQLPLDTAWKLVGTMAHPLNRAWYDEIKKRVTKGYGILQPRVTVSLPDITASLYAKMHGNEPGIDPYTRASSDVYQDLFSEGSFIGKGIYEIDICIKVLEGKFPENRILSHDLLEGCYVRSGLVSDIQLFERYPNSYRTDMRRFSRWVRGDWQIFNWFFPFVPGPGRHSLKNPISGLSRWKVFDNIRRSLIPVALTLMILWGWLILPSSLYWTMAVSAIIVIPIIITTIWDTLRKPKDVIFKHHVKNSLSNIIEIFTKTLFSLICLPYEGLSNLMAIVKTLGRMIITKKHLLEWNLSQKERISKEPSLVVFYLFMWVEPFLAFLVIGYITIYVPLKSGIAGPILLLWFIAPFVTWWTSTPMAKPVTKLTHEQNIFLRKIARKTWSFFEDFILEDDNWLPPDNFQEQPAKQIAHRTSPTNIGLLLLSNLSAHNFGYLTTGQFIERLSNTMATLNKMERYKGHFYNWYNTETLNPLRPTYISTVDSGNLLGNLLVLRQGLLTLTGQKILGLKIFQGIQDTLSVLEETLDEKNVKLLKQFKLDLDEACNSHVVTRYEVKYYMNLLAKDFTLIFEKLNADTESETYCWKNKLKEQIEKINEEFLIYEPWFLLMKAPPKFISLLSKDTNSTWIELLETARELKIEARQYIPENNTPEENEWLQTFDISLSQSIRKAEELVKITENLAQQCNELTDVELDFLFDKSSKLFTIGYNVQDHRIDPSFYDLLASEARVCIYIGIAQGKLPEESWFALGRILTNINGEAILLSWAGSMFEYLMPLLIMPTYENTLLDQTYKSVVKWQIDYGKKSNLPWGISESGYNMVNANFNYQYRAFGAPGLGLKRGLEEDTVIAPYASALALMIDPGKACKNLELLSEKGLEGRYGFYEAIDYTPSRLQAEQQPAIIYSFMAHHQGMSLLSLAYLLQDRPMQKLFKTEPQFKAALLLLQERIPKMSSFYTHTTDIADVNYVASGTEVRIINTPNTPLPEIQLLSNGKYHVMVTNAGGGYSRWKDLAVTRWREDGTCDNWGMFCYIRDLSPHTQKGEFQGVFWSNTYQPALKKGEKYEAAFSQGRVDFRITNNDIETHTEIVVSPEDDIEMRRVNLTNRSGVRKTIEVTSYAEIVLAHPAADLMQPAFSNLFVQTEILSPQHAILCTRRPRSADELPPWVFHLVTMQGKDPIEISYETDRLEFIGRGNTIVNPQAMNTPGPLHGKEGSVLDPIVAIRYKIKLEPEETVTVDLIIGVAETKDICLKMINKYQDKHNKDRVFELAWTHSQVVLRQINASEVDAQLYARLAGSVIFHNPSFRADPAILINNYRGQSGLWGYSISGDLPIVLLKVEKQANMNLVKQLIQAHTYWRAKGLAVDLVIWNEDHGGYRQMFQNEIQALIPAELVDRPGGVFVRASEQISKEDRILFQTVARVIISDNGGTLSDHVKRKPPGKVVHPYITPQAQKLLPSRLSISLPEDLVFFNGLGGFSPDGTQYIINTGKKNKTPAPWVNVLANPDFGTIVSESGAAYTWAENAHEFRLTPWNNDSVCDSGGEAYFIRDDETGHFWSATLFPKGGDSPYITHHGRGYSVFEHAEDGIYSDMTVYVDVKTSVKFNVLKIRNQSGRTRKLSATGYAEWVLGDIRMKTAMFIYTEIDPATGAIFAKNPYNTEFSNRVAFFDVDYLKKSFTADRNEFIGRNGTLKNPDALFRQKLSGKIGLTLDPCAAIQIPVDLSDGEEYEIIFRLGAGKTPQEASEIVLKYRGSRAAHESLEKVKEYWKHTLDCYRVETPDTATNILANGWLTYQTISSRLLGRSGYYQSGGAFGFRDQLQDVLSVMHINSTFAREQILLCASRQFKEGDVQHWWHPPSGRGVRTRCSDDYLWLPYVTAHYISHTGDKAVLDESISFLEGRLLNSGEESYYDTPIQSTKSAILYEHCILAIKHALIYGTHGLPLIGTGDWNDGFDKVGNNGKGESVWLAFFLYDILIRFESIAQLKKDLPFADECKKNAQLIKENIEKNAWDGQWYLRAWFDNKTPLGSSKNDECKIDSIAQSWAVLSECGDTEHTRLAMESAYTNLVKKESGIIQLLEPPFDKSDLNPGYIKGYVPGVRENGGQYTHAAVWLIIAFAKLNNNKRVWELLNMINPINHGKTPNLIATYKIEPYVLAADVYGYPPHTGRGGWTWYTGSAGWMYQLITRYFFGLQQEGNKLKFVPCVPEEWESFKVHYRYMNTVYHIAFTQPKSSIASNDTNNNQSEKVHIIVDGIDQASNIITLIDDGIEHYVDIKIINYI